MKNHAFVHWITLTCGIILLITLFCCKQTVRKVPLNYILLVTFTLLWSYMVAGFSSYTDPKVVLAAAVCSAFMFVGLTTLSCLISAERLNYCWGFLSVLLSMVLPGIIFMLMFRTKIIHVSVIIICILLFSFYIVYDTKKIILTLSVDEYIIGSLLIYVDFISLCICLITLFGINN